MSELPPYTLTINHKEQVLRSIDMFKLAAKMSNRYYQRPLLLCYSGGKDSDVILELAKMADIEFEVQHSRTSVDAPETMMHIKSVFRQLKNDGITCWYDNPSYKGQRITMWSLIPEKLMPPTRIVRYCCSVLKETGGKGRAIATGVRKAESISRRSRKFANNYSETKPGKLDFEDAASLFEDAKNAIEHDDNFIHSCKVQGKTSFQPIVDWEENDVWQFIDEQNIEINPLYYDGARRVGCIGCPMCSKRERERHFAVWPKYEAGYLRAFQRMINKRNELGLKTNWKTADEVMDWWLEK